jgi:hypothetical protein
MHVRVYCSRGDREFGCTDMGPMELLAERDAERSQLLELVETVTKKAATGTPGSTASLGARADRIDLRGWRVH